jgi:hypothetical protein
LNGLYFVELLLTQQLQFHPLKAGALIQAIIDNGYQFTPFAVQSAETPNSRDPTASSNRDASYGSRP